jgi:hypothetical protein
MWVGVLCKRGKDSIFFIELATKKNNVENRRGRVSFKVLDFTTVCWAVVFCERHRYAQ